MIIVVELQWEKNTKVANKQKNIMYKTVMK